MNVQRVVVAVDVGNTSIKLGEFSLDQTVTHAPQRTRRLASAAPDWDALRYWLSPAVSAVFLVSVCQPAADRLTAWFHQTLPQCPVRQLGLGDFPLRVDVEFPQRVGHDRLAAAVAASQLKLAGRAAIVVDAGSAITVDLISPVGDFLGGAILPGWQTMARSLAEGTHLLPHVAQTAFDPPPEVVGRSTEQAIASGLYWGSVGAVRELVERMSQRWDPAPDQLLAGGDLQVMAGHLGPQTRSIPDLVLRGVLHSARVAHWIDP